MLQKFKLRLKLQKYSYHEYNTGNVVVNSIAIAMMMIFMKVAVVSVNATEILATTENFAAVAATTARTLLHHNASRNSLIAQESPKTLPPQIPPRSSSSSFPMSFIWGTATSSLARKANHDKDILPDTHSNSIRNDNSNILLSTENMENCKSLTGTWGDVDPNIFYLCDMQTKQPLPIRCPEGKGYFNGLGYMGCIPYDQWPACVATSLHNQVHICDIDHMQQLWETANPNKFYICLQETTEPMLLNCGPGKGFVHAKASSSPGGRETGATSTVGASEIVGCANWEKWRSYMKCTDYY